MCSQMLDVVLVLVTFRVAVAFVPIRAWVARELLLCSGVLVKQRLGGRITQHAATDRTLVYSDDCELARLTRAQDLRVVTTAKMGM